MTARQQSAVALCAFLAITACGPRLDVPAGHNEAQARWEQQRLSDYSFQFQRLCECSEDYLRAVRITVSNGEIVDISFVDDQSQMPRETWTDFYTISGLFGAIEAAASENAFEIRVTYDANTGHPQSIFIDYDERIADDEKIWQVSDLQDMTARPQQAAQLQTPQKVQGRFADTVQGCSLLSRDGGSVGCYRQVFDGGLVEDRLEFYWVGSSEPKATLRLFSGQPGAAFDPAMVDDEGVAMANALLRQGGYESIGVVLDGDPMEHRVTQFNGEIIVSLGQREARAPLPAFDPDLVVSGFRGDPPECLYWLSTQLTVFDREGIAAVRLEPIADWNQDPDSPCHQPLGPDGQPLSDEIIGPNVGHTVVMATGMTWPAEPPSQNQQAAEPPAEPPMTPSAPPARPLSVREESVATIEKLGGEVTVDTARGVVTVTLRGDQFTDAELSTLRGIPDVTNLDIYSSKTTDAGLASLEGLEQLQALNIGGAGFTDSGLSRLKVLPKLTDLTLPYQVTDAGLAHVGELTGLTTLWLSSPHISDAGLSHLQNLKLQYAVFDGAAVSDAGLEKLKTMSDSLIVMRLGGTQVTDAGLVHLENFEKLFTLELGRTQVTDAGLPVLSGLPTLVNLGLDNTAITDAGLETLKRILTLRWVDLRNTGVTNAGAESLRQALPNATIHGPSPNE